MKNQIANSLLLFSIGFLLGFFMRSCNPVEKGGGVGGITTITKIDTLYISHTDTIRLTKIVPKPYKVVDTIYKYLTPVEVEDLLAYRYYSDSIQKDSVKVKYMAKTLGKLDSISFEVINNTPHTLIETHHNHYVYPSGFFLGGDISRQGVSIGLDYVNQKNLFSVEANPFNQEIRLGYKRRIN